ncbi:NADH-ubiquinone oxidoreductase chain 5, partial [Cucurbita argyrosperma subsp. sororia]
MIARCSPLFEYPPTALIVITSAGATTSFLAATTGILQNDLKRVIAYSTCSQLGYMIFACGISNYSVSVFHLMNHAFFKALLFLSAGSVIHAMSDEQDMRKMGGLASSFPLTYAMMLMGSLSLIGFPFLTGFYSKDVILELAYTKYTISGNFAFWLGSVSVLFTSYYSFRSLFLTFLVPTNSFGRDIVRCHDAPIPMAIPLILLALGSLFVGYLAKV